ncbi:MAG: HNH endonuclease signature motif containing protein [Candidatus Angelobacter sp.]
MRRIVALLLLCCLCSFAFAKGSGGHSSSHSGKSSKPSKAKKAKGSNAEKTVHVSGYTRKDGTHVAAYDRRPPGTAGPAGVATADTTTGSSTGHTYRHDYLADGITPHPSVQYNKHGKIKRSHAAKASFEREHPCPSTGKSTGRCPGYIVDHVHALECGGPDDPSNMQWQTTADAKAKDKIERQCRI